MKLHNPLWERACSRWHRRDSTQIPRRLHREQARSHRGDVRASQTSPSNRPAGRPPRRALLLIYRPLREGHLSAARAVRRGKPFWVLFRRLEKVPRRKGETRRTPWRIEWICTLFNSCKNNSPPKYISGTRVQVTAPALIFPGRQTPFKGATAQDCSRVHTHL